MLRSNVLIKYYRDGLYLFDLENNRQFKLDQLHSAELLKILDDPSYKPVNKVVQENFENFNINFIDDDKEIAWPIGEISRIFHLGTRDIYDRKKTYANRPEFRERFERSNRDCYQNLEKLKRDKEDHNNSIALPAVNIKKFSNNPFIKVILDRKTCRDFEKTELSLELLSEILYLTHGHCGKFNGNVLSSEPKRIIPSAGNIHPINIYVHANHITGLDRGVYFYDKDSHELSLIHKNVLSQTEMEELFLGQYFMENASFGLFISVDLEKVALKYPDSRSYKYAYLEAGVVAYHLQLLATFLGISYWQSGVFKDSIADEVLNLHSEETTTFYLAFGGGKGNALPKDFE